MALLPCSCRPIKRSNRRTLSQIGDYFKHLVGG
nr:MAG TPA: nucleoporin [Caudoviricetes sp.]